MENVYLDVMLAIKGIHVKHVSRYVTRHSNHVYMDYTCTLSQTILDSDFAYKLDIYYYIKIQAMFIQKYKHFQPLIRYFPFHLFHLHFFQRHAYFIKNRPNVLNRFHGTYFCFTVH